jgi:hypothetical protein
MNHLLRLLLRHPSRPTPPASRLRWWRSLMKTAILSRMVTWVLLRLSRQRLHRLLLLRKEKQAQYQKLNRP